MNLRGERFINHTEFIRYCKDLNVHTYESELEHFEKIGEMLPVARVNFPIEHVIDQELRAYCGDPSSNNARYMDVEAQDELRRLLQEIKRAHSSVDFSDDGLIHGFDREFDKKNKFLSRPKTDEFQAWTEYKVDGFSLISQSPLDKPVTPSLISARHYYSYWQVHQLYSVQQYLRKNGASQYLAIDAKMRSNFDALSFWITMYRRERQRAFARAFANVPDKYGVKRLDDSRYADYRKRLRNHADAVVDRFGLGRDGLYRFLYRLVELYESYRKNERYKLADALSQDVFDLQRLIELSLCDDFDKISDELRRISTNGAEGWSARGFRYRDFATTFRHLDIATKERDYACDLIARISAQSVADLEKLGCQDWSFTSADAKELLAYCEQEGLGLLLTALGGMTAVGGEEYRHNFRSVQMYTNLKNALTSYEYLLKSLGEKGGYKVGTNLGSAITATMGKQPWFALYIKKVNSTLVRANSEEEFFCNLEKLQKDRELQRTKKDGYWARMFLITHLARNAAVHLYPKGDRYFADPFGTTLHAVVNATCYTWKLAQSENWLSSESSDEPK